MTPDQLSRLRALLARGCFLPAARELAQRMLAIAERRACPNDFPAAGCVVRGEIPRPV